MRALRSLAFPFPDVFVSHEMTRSRHSLNADELVDQKLSTPLVEVLVVGPVLVAVVLAFPLSDQGVLLSREINEEGAAFGGLVELLNELPHLRLELVSQLIHSRRTGNWRQEVQHDPRNLLKLLQDRPQSFDQMVDRSHTGIPPQVVRPNRQDERRRLVAAVLDQISDLGSVLACEMVTISPRRVLALPLVHPLDLPHAWVRQLLTTPLGVDLGNKVGLSQV